MDGYIIGGIQQIGLGTTDFRSSWDWCIRNLGFDVKVLEDDTVAERMLPYTGGKPQKRHACIAVNLGGGGGLEIWQYSERKPQPAPRPACPGDLGVFAAKVRCRDITAFRSTLEERGEEITPVAVTPDGRKSFFVTDPEGNCFQILEDESVFIRQGTPVGGVMGAMTGVSDMDRSVNFYQRLLGYDRKVYDATGRHSDLTGLGFGDQSYRRVLLTRSEPSLGAFSELYGPDCIELVQALDRKAERIYEGRFWGDPGFIQVCYDIVGMDAFSRHCQAQGCPFTVDSCPDGEVFDMGEASGRFTYIEDPDGTLIEFVETFKVPVYARLGLYIDMKRRDPLKPLPKFLFRAMGITSRQKQNGHF